MIFQGTPLCSVVIQSSENDRKENESRKPVKPSYVVLFDSVSYRNNPVFLFETSNLFFKKLTFTQQTVRLNVFLGGRFSFTAMGKENPVTIVRCRLSTEWTATAHLGRRWRRGSWPCRIWAADAAVGSRRARR